MDSAGELVYSHQSDYVHSEFRSLMSLSQADSLDSKRLAEAALIFISVSYSVILEELSEIYPKLKQFIAKNRDFEEAIKFFKDFRFQYW